MGRHAGRQIFDLCQILGEHTRDKMSEATKTFFFFFADNVTW